MTTDHTQSADSSVSSLLRTINIKLFYTCKQSKNVTNLKKKTRWAVHVQFSEGRVRILLHGKEYNVMYYCRHRRKIWHVQEGGKGGF